MKVKKAKCYTCKKDKHTSNCINCKKFFCEPLCLSKHSKDYIKDTPFIKANFCINGRRGAVYSDYECGDTAVCLWHNCDSLTCHCVWRCENCGEGRDFCEGMCYDCERCIDDCSCY